MLFDLLPLRHESCEQQMRSWYGICRSAFSVCSYLVYLVTRFARGVGSSGMQEAVDNT